MCTTGVRRFGTDEYVLFKNKDFGRVHFDDRLVLEPNVFGVAGAATWAGTDPDLDRFSGFSIGANSAGLLCCDSNVRTPEADGDLTNYDDLVEIALRSAQNVADAAAAVSAAVAARPYLWANLILIDQVNSASLEVRGDHVVVVPLAGPTARSNHHVELRADGNDDPSASSVRRLVAAQARIEKASTVDDVFELLGAHDEGATGICNHAECDTVYSYVLWHRAGATTLFVAQGRPCETLERIELALPLGRLWSAAAAAELRTAYPSAHAMVEL